MVYRYVLLDTEELNEREITHALKKNPMVTEINPTIVEETAMADPLFENYNLTIKVEGDSLEEIENVINSDIQNLTGIKNIKMYTKE